MPGTVSRAAETGRDGPTPGERVRLADTELCIEVEEDRTGRGEEAGPGGGEAVRHGMGRSQATRHEGAADSVITNAFILDYWGIVKADIGIRDGRIAALGKAGDPDTQPDADIIVGPSTAVIPGEGRIVTAGGFDCHAHFICPQQVEEALHSGITTMLGGGAGPAIGADATSGTPGPWHITRMLQAAEGWPMNLAFAGNGDAARPDGLAEQIRAGACALELRGDRGTTPAAIDCCLAVADEMDIQVLIRIDTLAASGSVEDTIRAFKGRAIHAFRTAAAGGGSAPDIIRLCGEANVLPSSTNPLHPCTANSVDEQLGMLMARHRLDPKLPEDVALAKSRIRAETLAAEDILHDLGAFSLIGSDSRAMGRAGEVIIRTWQIADEMKRQRGRLHDEAGDNDNARAKRYVAKYTINPAIAHGMAAHIGSIEVGKLADLVLWRPAFFGVKPDLVLKCGTIAAALIGDPNALLPTAQPAHARPMVGAFGRARIESAVTFVSRAALEHDLAGEAGLQRRLVAVEGTRTIDKRSMVWNDALPRIEVDPKTLALRADGEPLACTPAAVLPMAQRYFLF